MPATTYSVPDITCDHCKKAIEAEVGNVVGSSAGPQRPR